MAPEVIQSTSAVAAALSTLAAIFSGACAFLSYRLARSIQLELKSDERIIAGTPIHPELQASNHKNCIVQCTLFNKSKRKAYINSVVVLSSDGKPLKVTWSDQIDDVGNPQNPCELIGIVDSCQLYVRRNDSEWIHEAQIKISHSFSEAPLIVHFATSLE